MVKVMLECDDKVNMGWLWSTGERGKPLAPGD